MNQWGEDGNSGHFVDYYKWKGINNWLPYSQSPRPYAICRKTVYSIMLRLFGTIQSFIISRQLLTLIFSVLFLIVFCFAVLKYRCVLYRLTTTLCVPLSVMDLEEFDVGKQWQAHFQS